MKTLTKTVLGMIFGVGMLAGAQANAEYRPDYCAVDHDHRSHQANYYNYYEKDRYYRGGDYRRDRYDRRDRSDRRDRYDRRDRGYKRYGRARSRVVHRETYQTKYDARIVLVEEVYYTRSGREQLVCSVLAKGYDRDYVSRKRLRRVANRDCSRYARIQYLRG